MKKKIILFFFFCLILFVFYLGKFYNKKNKTETVLPEIENIESSNLLSELNFSSKDDNGNIYTLIAQEGEIDFENNNIIFLKKIKATVKLNNSEEILISSDFGKYNTKNFDTIFSKNVIVKYLNNKITGEYLDFSLESNLMVISRDIVYTNLENVLVADVLEMNIETKDTKIYMYENKKKVNIKNKN